MNKLDVMTLFEDNQEHLHLEVINGEHSFAKPIEEPNLNRPSLALAGFTKVFTHKRVQILGNTEMEYLNSLDDAERRRALETVMQFDIPCIVVTESNEIFPLMLKIAEEFSISIFRTKLQTTELMHLLSEYMDIIFAPTTTVHGSLVDVYGMGVLFTGRSAIGKSEIALDLVERGHRLVADDAVNLYKLSGDVLVGRGSELLQHHMEIRGLGIIDVKNLFGINAIRVQKRIEVEVKLVDWDDNEEYERIGLDETHMQYLGVKVPLVKLPIFPGKNITVIAEVIALNQMLKVYGHNTAQIFSDRLINKIQSKSEEGMPSMGPIMPTSIEKPDRSNIRRYIRRDFE